MIKTSKEYKQSNTIEIGTTVIIKFKMNFCSILNSHLQSDNRERFHKIFGKPDFHYRGEFDFHCWSLDFQENNYIILTAKGKGTCYEVVRDGWEIEETDKQFLDFVLAKLKELK